MNEQTYLEIASEANSFGAKLIAVSKTKPNEAILSLYNKGQRLFGENKVQELCDKQASLPADIEWHLIGHLQTNKVKDIAPFVALIHAVDSQKLLIEINKQAEKNERVIPVLLQIHIAQEETKFGFDLTEVRTLLNSHILSALPNVEVCGLMGMATNTDNEAQIATEFESLYQFFQELKSNYFSDKPAFRELSMGMSSDYKIALKHGATYIRVGSVIFGER